MHTHQQTHKHLGKNTDVRNATKIVLKISDLCSVVGFLNIDSLYHAHLVEVLLQSVESWQGSSKSNDLHQGEVLVDWEVKLWENLRMKILSFSLSDLCVSSQHSITTCMSDEYVWMYAFVQGVLPCSPSCVPRPKASWPPCWVWPPSGCGSPVSSKHQ